MVRKLEDDIAVRRSFGFDLCVVHSHTRVLSVVHTAKPEPSLQLGLV